MSGLYIHIPFCRQKCSYCNFHFSTTRHSQQEMVNALCKEMSIRSDFLPGISLSSIYLGGGTPSLLTKAQLEQLFTTIGQTFAIQPGAEITLEANPDDLSETALDFLKNQTPINRLSVGVQSFKEEDLKFMNRAHNSTEAITAIDRARKTGFDQFNLDLIFGLPGQTMANWMQNLEQFLLLDLDHISCYSLSIERKTPLYHWIRTGKVEAPDDDHQANLFLKTIEILRNNGYEHYEISNYCRQKKYAVHNTNYWKGAPYLGIGPSAHSYDGNARYFNVAHNARYLKNCRKESWPMNQNNLPPRIITMNI